MIDPDQLFDQAAHLASRHDKRPRQADLRRSISSSYYGLFHALAGAASEWPVGSMKKHQSQYALIYRTIDHGHILDTLKKLPREINELSHDLGNPHSSWPKLAEAVHILQALRHSADYDPIRRFAKSEAEEAISLARDAIAMFERLPDAQRHYFLTRLVARPRRS